MFTFQNAFDIDHNPMPPTIAAQISQLIGRNLRKRIVRHGPDYRIDLAGGIQLDQLDPILHQRFPGRSQRIMHQRLATVILQLTHNIDHLAVADIGHVFLSFCFSFFQTKTGD